MRGGRRLPCRLVLGATVLWLVAAPARAGSPVPYAGDFRAEIEATFFDVAPGSLGRVSDAKVAAYRAFIENKRAYVADHVTRYEVIEDGEDAEDVRDRIPKLDTVVALDHIAGLLDRMQATTDPAEAYDLAAEIVMVEYATRAYTDPIGSIKIPIHLKNMVFEWRVANASRARHADREATNLVNQQTGDFYTAEELAELIRAGADLSLLNPPDETPFWRNNGDIRKIDIVRNYLEGGDPIHSGVVSEFPRFDGAQFELDKPHLTQSKPKLDVYWVDDACARRSPKKQKKCRKKVKLKFGMETHADPVGNALLSAMGFNVDVSMHLKNVRVYLGDSTLSELESAWYAYFDQQRMHTYIPLDSVLYPGEAGRNRDEKGEYVVFQETVAELKEPEYERIGFFAFSDRMAADFREARGLFIFNAWIANSDMKDEENNKLILRRLPDGSTRMYLVQQDVGHAMGRVLPEKPEAFPWDLVESDPWSRFFGWANGSIEFNYINLQDAGLEHTTTYADAKWMTRRIAQLSRKQIEDAVGLGHWPGGIPQLYIEKLVNRRNQLVVAFGLEDEYGLLPVDRHITTADGSVVDGELVRNTWYDESPIRYNDYYAALMGPVGTFFADRLMVGLQTGIAALDVINPGNVRITGELRFLPRVLVQFSREVILNPEPVDETDQYIVVDSVGVGLRLGVGFIASGEVSGFQKFTLAYPVATRREGIRGDLGLAHLILPIDVWRGALPERFVLHRELKFKAGARVSTDHSDFLSPVGLDGDQGWVTAFRSVVDRRGKNPVVWVDRPQYLEGNVQMFLEAAVLQVPFLGGSSSVGSLAGRAIVLDGDRLDLAGDDGIPYFEKMVRFGDFRNHEKLQLGSPRRAEVSFDMLGGWWNLLFANWRNRTTNETIKVTDDGGRVLHVEHQTERRKTSSWRFLDNGETQQLGVRGFVDGDGKEPQVVARFEIDDLNTHSDELDSYYALLQGLGAGEGLLSDRFRARDWEITGEPSGRWTRMLAEGSVYLRPEALRRLVGVDREGYWSRLADNLGLSPREFAAQQALSKPAVGKDSLTRRRSLSGRHVRGVIRRSRVVLGFLDEAAAAPSELDRVRLIVKAIYRACFRRGDSYDPIVLATLMQEAGLPELIDRDDISVSVRVTRAFEDEMNLPERRAIVGRLGGAADGDMTDYRMFPFTGIDYYRMLDWVSDFE